MGEFRIRPNPVRHDLDFLIALAAGKADLPRQIKKCCRPIFGSKVGL